jgi:hypothetical protein
MNTESKYWLAVDYISYGGGTNNLQRARIMVSGMGGYIKLFTSGNDKAEERAKRWAKKNNINL